MSLMFNGTISLGPILEASRAFRHFGQLSPNNDYGYLHGAFHAALAESTGIPQGDLDNVSMNARRFLAYYDAALHELDSHEIWILQQLVNCNKPLTYGNYK